MPRRPGPKGVVPVGDGDDENYFKPLCEGDVLQASNSQRAIVATTSMLALAGLVRVGLQLGASPTPIASSVWCIFATVMAIEFADFGTGVYHWSVDNYGNAKTPIVGSQIEAFQGHHEEPWTITYRDFCNNCHPTCLATLPAVALFTLAPLSASVRLWGVLACLGIAFCQEFHKWSHTLRSQCHPLVNRLQSWGVLVARKAHLTHHKPPFETNYCIVTGHMNPVLDRSGFFRASEGLVERLTGVRARCQTGARFDYLLSRRGAKVAARS